MMLNIEAKLCNGRVYTFQANVNKTVNRAIDDKINAISKGYCCFRSKKTNVNKTNHSISPLKLLWWASLFVGARAQLTDLFPAQFELSSLDGSNGFVLNGENAGEHSGEQVSTVGDVNGDGLDDLVIGAPNASPLGRSRAGRSYVIYGQSSSFESGIFDLSSLNGTNGFIIYGEVNNDFSGGSVTTAGDVNGDGFSDIVIGAFGADRLGRVDVGVAYVVFGSMMMVTNGTFELSSLNGTNGYIIYGETPGDQIGYPVSSAGDVNGDGLADIVLGSRIASPVGRPNAGKSYVVYGSRATVVGGTLELSNLNGTNGFIINGEAGDDRSGFSVSSAGDVNGDGLSDIIIGAYRVRDFIGRSYVIYGSRIEVMGGTFELSNLNGSNGFILDGEISGDQFGVSVSSAGDVNGDGFSDLVIGAWFPGPPSNGTGKSYVVFGSRIGVSSGIIEMSSLNGTNGFILNGVAVGDKTGRSVSTAGDVNGDGYEDIVIGARRASPSGKSEAGKSYIVYGSHEVIMSRTRNLSDLNGTNGFTIYGEAAGDKSGNWVSSAGDFNGDGLSDLVIGAYQANPNGKLHAGRSYVIFGRKLAQTTLQAPQDSSTSPFQHSSTSNTMRSTSFITNGKTVQTEGRSSTHLKTISHMLLSPTLDPLNSPSDSSPLIAGIATTVTALVFSLCAGVIFYLKKHPGNEFSDLETSMDKRNSDPSENQYDLLPSLRKQGDYKDCPNEAQLSNPENYTSIDKVEKAHEIYVEDKMEKAHVHYAEIRQ